MLDTKLAAYPFECGRFDELFERPYEPRPHWARLYAEITQRSADEIRERLASAERQIRESGITYNVYADPKGHDRPWDLDVLPFVIAPDEWREIEAGIVQRATAFNAILADLYGGQSLLKSGAIPASLIFGQSGFLRPVHGVRPSGGIHLHVYAADLARSPDGQWWVMADRTQAPSGAGYALANRLVVSRAFPALYRELRVEHLARFFATLRDSLMHFAPKGDGQTLTVLLTPGPYNETYFEHALLARYLGFPLVEGADLTARDGRVWLKTIGGLKRVHAILRRQDDAYCDPLELRSDSALGIAGLVECACRGTVLVANALGSGVIESGALLGFLPRLAERLTGEPLRMPSIATWWCGERAALVDALAQVEQLVFKPADRAHGFEPIFGADLDADGLRDLRSRLSAHPERFVAQELVRVSRAPVLGRADHQRIAARGVGVRVFAVGTPSGYVVMPGGLTRVTGTENQRVVSMQRGGQAKDTWVLSSAPVDTSFTLLRSTVSPNDVLRMRAGIPSRLAENLFWFGRYAERCDDSARLLRVALNLSFQEGDGDDNARVPVLALARALQILEKSAPDEERALLAAATEESYPFGLPANLRALEAVAFNLRDRMSLDNWRTINSLVKDPAFGRPASLAEALAWLERTVTSLMTLSGFALDGMTRDDGWRLLSIGRRLERLAFQCLALRVAFREGLSSGLGWLLELADSTITYRSRYLARPEWLPVLDLLVMDAANPRSVMFQADGIYGYLLKLEPVYGSCGSDELEPKLRALQGLAPDGFDPQNEAMRTAIDELRTAAFRLSDRLTQRFFNHVHAPTSTLLGL
ncbi:MAG: molybdopterin oxidoreductase [Betaproteobacteria bacterium]|nr:MAG: molybdopterin oxidoreductase [Betaproteobacteria bacterium]